MVETPQAPATPAASIDAAPVVTPVVEISGSVSDTTPAIAPESAVEPTIKTVDKAAEPFVSESALGDIVKPEIKPDAKIEEKIEPAKAEVKEGAKTDVSTESVKSDVVVELPSYEPFKLPDGVEVDKAPLDAFSKVLGEIETGKLDHAGMQEAGQKLVDLATKATAESIERLNDYYVQIHEGAKKARLDALKADPDLGGDKFENTVSTLQRAIAEYGGTDSQIAEFRKEVVEAGLDASPALCRLLSNMQQKINKYTTEADNGNGGNNRIVPAARPAPSKVKDYQRFYAGGN